MDDDKTIGRFETKEQGFRRPLLLRVNSTIMQNLHKISARTKDRENWEMPEESSPQHETKTGELDKRISLDETISREEVHRYYASLCVMASELVYEDYARIKYVVRNHWKMKFLGSENYWNEYLKRNATQAFMMSDEASNGEETILVAFRGTSSVDDIMSDVDINWWDLPGVGKIHGGFVKALGLQLNNGWPKDPLPNPNRKSKVAYYDIRDKLKSLTSQNDRTRFVVTGHSLGGALAILFVFVLILHDEVALLERLLGVYTFGQPRVGDPTFAEFMETKLKEHLIAYYRIVYNYDIVARLPFDDRDLMFTHFGKGIYYDRHYIAKVTREDPLKDYFSLTNTIGSVYNTIMEFKRNFMLGLGKLSEGKQKRSKKVVGMVLPFLNVRVLNHLSYGYVNAIRLGPPEVFQVYKDVLIE